MGKFVAFISFVAFTTICHAQPKITRYEPDYSINFEARKLFCAVTINITPGDTLNLLLYRPPTVRSVPNQKTNQPKKINNSMTIKQPLGN